MNKNLIFFYQSFINKLSSVQPDFSTKHTARVIAAVAAVIRLTRTTVKAKRKIRPLLKSLYSKPVVLLIIKKISK